ncbi:MAG: IS1096 element passenger TnpR family protein [Salibacteraceae bacterium]
MSTTLRLRVLIDTEGDNNVFRDIEMPSNSTFEEFHIAIQENFNFDNSQMASFYESDDSWERGDEIMLMDMSMDDKQKVRLMKDVLLGEILEKEDQKMLYIFDFLVMWTFFIEVVSLGEFSKETSYPNVLLSVGDAPDQQSKSAEDLFGSMKSEMMPGAEDDGEDFDEFDLENNYPSY